MPDISPHVERPARLAGGKTYCSCGQPWPCPQAPDAAPAASPLDAIRADLRTAADGGLLGIKAGDYLPAALARHSRDLLKAVEAALKLADEALPVDRDYGGEPIWWNLTPGEIREAITAALAGTQRGEDGDHA